jgi:hypothetical protein
MIVSYMFPFRLPRLPLVPSKPSKISCHNAHFFLFDHLF